MITLITCAIIASFTAIVCTLLVCKTVEKFIKPVGVDDSGYIYKPRVRVQ